MKLSVPKNHFLKKELICQVMEYENNPCFNSRHFLAGAGGSPPCGNMLQRKLESSVKPIMKRLILHCFKTFDCSLK